jgi:hypothetical protein
LIDQQLLILSLLTDDLLADFDFFEGVPLVEEFAVIFKLSLGLLLSEPAILQNRPP